MTVNGGWTLLLLALLVTLFPSIPAADDSFLTAGVGPLGFYQTSAGH